MIFLSDVSDSADFGFNLGGILRKAKPRTFGKPIKQVSGGMLNATNRATTQYKTLGALRKANKPKGGGLLNGIKSKFVPKPKTQTFGQMINRNKAVTNSGGSTLNGNTKLVGKVRKAGFGTNSAKGMSAANKRFNAPKIQPIRTSNKTFGQMINSKPRKPRFGTMSNAGIIAANNRFNQR